MPSKSMRAIVASGLLEATFEVVVIEDLVQNINQCSSMYRIGPYVRGSFVQTMHHEVILDRFRGLHCCQNVNLTLIFFRVDRAMERNPLMRA